MVARRAGGAAGFALAFTIPAQFAQNVPNHEGFEF
jgi:hypothetical protein